MKIEIEYNGSIAICKIDGKLFNDCDSFEQIYAMDAFRTIINDWKRNKKEIKNSYV